MPNIPVTIGTPILLTGESFRVRAREYPSGSFGAPQSETNAPFNIVVANAGEYEIEIVHILADDTECPAVYRRYVVPIEYNCSAWDFTPNMIEEPVGSGIYYVQLNYGTSAQPPCGWTVIYGGNTTLFPALPTSPLKIPSNNTTQRLIVKAEFCNGQSTECLNTVISKITPPEPPACIPVVIVSSEVILQDGPGGFQYYLKVLFTQSTPPTPFADFQWQQTGTPKVPGTPLDSGSFVQINPGFLYWVQGTNRYILLKIYPTVTFGQITYTGRMRDICGAWHNFTAVL